MMSFEYHKTYCYVVAHITVTVLLFAEECRDSLSASKCATHKKKGNCELENIKLLCSETCEHCNEIGELNSGFGDKFFYLKI